MLDMLRVTFFFCGLHHRFNERRYILACQRFLITSQLQARQSVCALGRLTAGKYLAH